MNHEQYEQLVSAFIDREIRAEDEQELFNHLNSCADCREFLKASCRLQADMAATRAKQSFQSVKTLSLYDADRKAVPQMYRSSRSRSAISTFVLLAAVTLIVAILFSANVKMERPADGATQELVQPR